MRQKNLTNAEPGRMCYIRGSPVSTCRLEVDLEPRINRTKPESSRLLRADISRFPLVSSKMNIGYMRHEVVLSLPESFITPRDWASPIRQLTLSIAPFIIAAIIIILATRPIKRTRSLFLRPHSCYQLPPSPPLPPVTITAYLDGASSPNLSTYKDGGYSLVVRLPRSLAVCFIRARRQFKGLVVVPSSVETNATGS